MQGVADATVPATAAEERAARVGLPVWRKILYSPPTLGLGALDYIVAVFLLKYYTDYTGLDARLAGLALLLGKAFDAVSDPVMGYVSDRTKGRWGRRRPWFLVGGFPLAVSFAAMFSASPAWSQTTLFVWLTATNVLFWMGNTIIDVPHAALGSELTKTHEDRISIMGWRQAFGTIGLLAGAFLMFQLLEGVEVAAEVAAKGAGLTEEATADAVRIARGEAHGGISVGLGVFMIAMGTLAFFGTREPSGPRTPPRDSLFGDFSDTLRSGPFRIYAIAFIVGQIADGLTATLALYVIDEWWDFGPPHTKLIMMGYLVMATISIPIWVRIGRHFEKFHMLAAGIGIAPFALTGMLFVPNLGLVAAYVLFYIAGIGLGGRTVMMMAIVPDIVDDDEVRTHTRKDGAYFGMFSLLRKLSRAGAIGLSGIGLGLFGYVTGAAHQTPEAVRGIIVMFCIVPSIASAISSLIILRFPITRAKHAEARTELDRRHAAAVAATAPAR